MIVTRRNLLAGAGSFAAFAAVAAPISASAARLKAIGIQLYTVREIFAKDPLGTLEAIARIGYREVEYGGGGYDLMDHAMLRKTMDRLGLRAPSIHVGYDALLQKFGQCVTMAKTLGADTVVLPSMPNELRNGPGYEAALPNFNRFATDLKAAGLGFAYHNHDFEFTIKPDGVSLYDRFLKATDPALVKIELDLFWAILGGQDLEPLIRRLRGRIYAYHVKDKRADGSMTAVGQGTLDFAALFRADPAVSHFYVENDEAPAPYLPDITTSFQALRALRY